MVFCNIGSMSIYEKLARVTILILIDGFLQYNIFVDETATKVTILILIDGFLQ